MSESLRKKIVYSTLPLALLWAAFNLPGRKKAPATPVERTVGPVIATVPSTKPGPGMIDVADKQQAPWGEDPFRSDAFRRQDQTGEKKTSAKLEWLLSGIIHNHDRPLAFINKKMVGVGDVIDKATVLSINKHSVTLEYQGRRVTLKIEKG